MYQKTQKARIELHSNANTIKSVVHVCLENDENPVFHYKWEPKGMKTKQRMR